MSSAWIGLIGALGGVLLTGLIGLGTAALTHRWQRDIRQQERLDHLNETRAELRRDAYARFLVASDSLWEFMLVQPAQDELDKEDPVADITERLRAIRNSAEKQFSEFDASYLQVRLISGVEVENELANFHDWFIEEFVTALQQSDALRSQAVKSLEGARQPLIDAMKAEQKTDLGFA